MTQDAELVRMEVRSHELRNGDLLHAGRDVWRTVKGCWHTESSCGAAVEGLYYSLTWSQYEILTIKRLIEGQADG